jgi:hypothetical protein
LVEHVKVCAFFCFPLVLVLYCRKSILAREEILVNPKGDVSMIETTKHTPDEVFKKHQSNALNHVLKLKSLLARADTDGNNIPRPLNWADVGTMAHTEELLSEILDFVENYG